MESNTATIGRTPSLEKIIPIYTIMKVSGGETRPNPQSCNTTNPENGGL